MGAHFLQILHFELQEIVDIVAGRGDQVMGATAQPGSVEFTVGEGVGQCDEIAVMFVQGRFRPPFQIVGNPVAGAVDHTAQTVPAAATEYVAKRPFRRGLGQRLAERTGAGGDGGLGTGLDNGRRQRFAVFRPGSDFFHGGSLWGFRQSAFRRPGVPERLP